MHLEEQYIILRKTKKDSEQIVLIGVSMKVVLEDYIGHCNAMPLLHVADASGLLFVKSDGTSLRTNAVYQYFRKLLDKCGIPKLTELCSPINAFVYPDICKTYDYDN